MVDFHTHILPCVDDGSQSVDESLRLVKKLKSQGVSLAVATPHFYANHDTVEEFLDRRNKSFYKLKELLPQDSPEIILGAEVKYYSGIFRLENLSSLCLEGTKLLLLEMPFSKWTEYTVNELINFAHYSDIKIVLAHIERYLAFQSKDIVNKLVENGILIQCNASFFTDFKTKRKALKMLGLGQIHFLGSDCHNMTTRPPHYSDAVDVIRNKFGGDFVNSMVNYAEAFFSPAENKY